MAIDLKFRRNHFQQFLFHQLDILAGGKVGAVAHAKDVSVHGNGWPAKGGIQHHVSGFTPDARQGLQRGAVFRHLAAVQLQQHAAGLNHVLGFAVKQADGLDVRLNAFYAQLQHRLRRVGNRIKLCGGFIDADVGSLRREQDGNQEFKRRGKVQLGRWVRVVIPQALQNG